jgi:hypothetical protein
LDPPRRAGARLTVHEFTRISMSQIKPDPMLERDFLGYGEHAPNPDWPGVRVSPSTSISISREARSDRSHTAMRCPKAP